MASNRVFGDYRKGDERILGDTEFVEEVLNAADEKMEDEKVLRQQGVDLEMLVQVVAELLKIDAAEVWKPGKSQLAVQAKSLVCYWAARELGLSATAVGKRLAISQPTASRAVQRGERLAAEKGWNLKQLMIA